MTMKPLDESQYDEWDRFVAKANGTIFHNAWWYRAWGVKFDVYACRDENGEIEAGMPVYISKFKQMPKLLGVKGLTKPPLTLVNGPLFLDSAKAGRSSRYAHEKKEALRAISSLPKADFYDIFLHSFQDDLMPYIWNGFDTQVYYTYVIRKEDVSTWRNNVYDTARSGLKKAHKEFESYGCTIETDPPIDELMPTYLETAELKGYSVGLKSFAKMMPGWWKAVKEKGAGRSYLLRDRDGMALCATMMVWDNRTAYSMISGMHPKVRKNGNLNMLLWERKITDSLEMGLDFDFEGSTLMGVEGFFRRWGGELRPCYRVTKVPSVLTYIGIKGYRYLKSHRNRRWIEERVP